MKIETKEILLKFDEVGSLEFPSNYDYDNLIFQIKRLKNELENIFSSEFKLDDNVQDASFISDLIIPNNLLLQIDNTYRYSIRFSNYGKLVTINGIQNLNSNILEIIQDVIKKNEFIFLEPNEIDLEYDGKFENFKLIYGERIPTWFERYFDYL